MLLSNIWTMDHARKLTVNDRRNVWIFQMRLPHCWGTLLKSEERRCELMGVIRSINTICQWPSKVVSDVWKRTWLWPFRIVTSTSKITPPLTSTSYERNIMDNCSEYFIFFLRLIWDGIDHRLILCLCQFWISRLYKINENSKSCIFYRFIPWYIIKNGLTNLCAKKIIF